MSLSDQDVNRIVDTITRRVESELTKVRGNAQNTAPCSTCSVADRCDAKNVIGSINAGARRIGTNQAIDGAPCAHVAPFIDQTLLKPEATRDELQTVSDEARQFGFASVCVNSSNIRFVAQCLKGSSVMPIAVVGFPLGAATPGAKAFETREAIRNGALEIDMVINIGALKSRDLKTVFEDIKAVVDAAQNTPVKVILENSKLDHDEKVIGCALSKAAGAAFVKTSTGFGGGGATPDDVALMRSVVGDDMGVKASGGVRTIEDAERVIAAGATRIGASSSVAIVRCDTKTKSSGY